MPQTVPDGFEFEGPLQVAEDLGRTLHGGEHGTSPILAEQVQSKVSTFDASIASLATRVAALEDGTGGVGWIPIQSGSDSGTSFTVDLTDGGRFPDPPLWTAVHLLMRFDLDDVATLTCRVNGDDDSVYTSGLYSIDAGGTTEDPFFFTGADRWVIGAGATVSTNNLDMTLFHTATNPGLLGFQSTSTRMSTNDSAHKDTHAWGALTSAKTITSLQIFVGNDPDAGDEFTNAWWSVLGLRMTAP